jgi:hypothetical protein
MKKLFTKFAPNHFIIFPLDGKKMFGVCKGVSEAPFGLNIRCEGNDYLIEDVENCMVVIDPDSMPKLSMEYPEGRKYLIEATRTNQIGIEPITMEVMGVLIPTDGLTIEEAFAVYRVKLQNIGIPFMDSFRLMVGDYPQMNAVANIPQNLINESRKEYESLLIENFTNVEVL